MNRVLHSKRFEASSAGLQFRFPAASQTEAFPLPPTRAPQLAALPGLERLLLSAPRAPMAEEFRPLSVLTSLTCLHMLGYAFVPESISHLTWLSELR